MTHATPSGEPVFQSVLPSTFANLERMVEATEAFLQRQGEDEDLVYRVTLLASEAVTNAMEHGNRYDPEKMVTLTVVIAAEHIEMTVEDEGDGFEQDDVVNPLAEEHLLDDRGRGLFFMRQMADEVHRDQDGRRVRLIFYRTS